MSELTPPQIVAATLRQISQWGIGQWGDDDRITKDLQALAHFVENEDYDNGMVCPMCQEIECDGGCPLEYYRDKGRA